MFNSFWDKTTIQEFWSGKSFLRPDDGQPLSYELAKILVQLLDKNYEMLARFCGAAKRDDAGQEAAQRILGAGLEDLVSIVVRARGNQSLSRGLLERKSANFASVERRLSTLTGCLTASKVAPGRFLAQNLRAQPDPKQRHLRALAISHKPPACTSHIPARNSPRCSAPSPTKVPGGKCGVRLRGLDANYDAHIESSPAFPLVLKYHEDGVAFWRHHKKHHPFLLADYRGGGQAITATSHRRVSSRRTCRVSFVELLHIPTVGGSKLKAEDFNSAHLDELTRNLEAVAELNCIWVGTCVAA